MLLRVGRLDLLDDDFVQLLQAFSNVDFVEATMIVHHLPRWRHDDPQRQIAPTVSRVTERLQQ